MTVIRRPLRLSALLGSLRAESNSSRVAGLVVTGLRAGGDAVDVIDPRALALAVPGLPTAAAQNARIEADLRARVTQSDGVLLVTPEYDGSFSAVLKILIEHLGYPSVLCGKPVALLGVASGTIGAVRALEHLRGMCVAIGAIVMPEAHSVAAAHRHFDAQGVCVDAGTTAEAARLAAQFALFVRFCRGERG